jgi:hypothetical protein
MFIEFSMENSVKVIREMQKNRLWDNIKIYLGGTGCGDVN